MLEFGAFVVRIIVEWALYDHMFYLGLNVVFSN